MIKALTLSIIIPAYNEERHLRTCLQSIANQTEKPDQVIVVDNNSRDATKLIAQDFPFVTVVTEMRQGIVFARDAGFNMAHTDLIGRIDADTVLFPDWVHEVKRHYAERAKYSELFAATGPSYFRNGVVGSTVWYAAHRVLYFWTSRLFARHHTLSGSNMYFTRASWQKVRSEVCQRTDIHEDMDLAIHLYHSGTPIIFSRAFPNYMLGRNVVYKLRHYALMWVRILFIRHRFSHKNTQSDV